MSLWRPQRIVSGGQTGADRGGLDAAIDLGIPHGGWCPSKRRAEDGPIPDRYRLEETRSEDYAVRTRQNVQDSDATIIFTRGGPTGGSAFTKRIAEGMGRPHLHVDLALSTPRQAAEEVGKWLAENEPSVLNVAGSRESQCPGIAEYTKEVLSLALTT